MPPVTGHSYAHKLYKIQIWGLEQIPDFQRPDVTMKNWQKNVNTVAQQLIVHKKMIDWKTFFENKYYWI